MATKVPATGHSFRNGAGTESTGLNSGAAESAEQGCNTAVANSSSSRSTASPRTARETPPIGMDDTSAGATFKDEQSDPLRSPSESSDSLLLTAVCRPSSFIGRPSSDEPMSIAFTAASYADLRTETETPTEFLEATDSSSQYLSPGRHTASSSSQSTTRPGSGVKLRQSSSKAAASGTDQAFAFSPRCYTNSSSVPKNSPGDKLTKHGHNGTSSSSLSSERDATNDFDAFSPRRFLSSTRENAVGTYWPTKLESLDRPSRPITPTSDASPLHINISVEAQSGADPTWQRFDYVVIPPKHVTFNGHLYERMD